MKSIAFILAVTSALAFSCGGASTEDPESARSLVTEKFNRFGFDFFAREADRAGGDNIFISPASISFALAMTAGGSEGKTRESMYNALQLSGVQESTVRLGSRELYSTLTTEKEKLILHIANSIWLRKGIRFHREFVKATREYFFAESFPITTPEAINSWVSDNTAGRIDKIVDSISGNDVAFLINAVYFKGAWKKEFDPEQTSVKEFKPTGADPIKVDMMRRNDDFRYMDADSFRAVAIPYGEGEMSIYLFLPGRDYGLGSLNEDMNYQWWKEHIGRFSLREGTVELPKLRLEYESVINNPLISMGMGIAFSPKNADFTRMCKVKKENVFISEVLHKTFLQVNEEGTEAAAVTSVRMRATSVSMDRPRPFHLVFDRPFFIAIVDERTGSILFMGNITLPPEAGSVE
ncbi:MAG: serpin family protein [Candidatus Latescibacteria bacterium]|nr:serpin family protein [bacterium]MBD3425470.1 serpin family protein [Candidatus Latescibacterota bacterium]